MDHQAWVSTVASQFLSTFTGVRANHPQHLHKFYKPESSLTVSIGDDTRTVGGDLQAIQDLVVGQLSHVDAQVTSQIAQSSLQNGVLIQCSGRWKQKGVESRFVETFLLAPQENGYYVHNSMLHVLPKEDAEPARPVTPPRMAQQSAPVAKESAPAATAPAPAPASKAAPAAAHPAKESNGPAAPAATPATGGTWASIIKQPKAASPGPTQPAAQPAPAAPAPAPAKEAAQPAQASQEGRRPRSRAESPAHESAAPVHGVYVRNLPQEHLAVESLEAEFSKYGALKPRDAPPAKPPVIIHNTTKDGKVAYVLYADAAGVEAVLKATVLIGDQQCEIKKLDADPSSGLSYYGRGGTGRGTFQGGRGAGGRGDGPKGGRGYSGEGGRGGRGEGRGDR
eukprot:CAMPEP_0202860116 /NCGR_PEP_ID=MMETSP1391-20130828/1963_1 /ASSEMBLY_ACC=CAM_ASM_000867 /TAXON_ID=1034604 /ORGANISM="Chlamydomonas leiostraca, Strain SAG 11-49" /LENGTH=394 /DNA_ID=CAMNT_0049539251 /DNA_START=114 /DNA_END=1295 /DNA_ORIENTATION=+